jgi:hypothetical protein
MSIGWSSLFKKSVSYSLLLLLLLAPQQSSQAAIPQPVQATSSTNALKYVKSLVPKSLASQSGYQRSKFSSSWGRINMKTQSGTTRACDLRNYILTRDLTKITRRTSDWCIVETGVLKDPYTAKTINFVRGVKTSSAVQIDHVVALSNAWKTGAQNISATARYQIANDPLNLLAVDGPTNASKSDKDASLFLPRLAYQCKYVARQLSVKRKYKLWVTTAEKTKMVRVLTTCPKQTLP